MILLAVGEGSDQTARMRKLVWPSLSVFARRYVFAQHGLYNDCDIKAPRKALTANAR